jgi:hypothetical protein
MSYAPLAMGEYVRRTVRYDTQVMNDKTGQRITIYSRPTNLMSFLNLNQTALLGEIALQAGLTF